VNELSPPPRHRQKPIAIRSNKAARLLALLTRDGRSQAQVIEDALEQAVAAASPKSLEEWKARIDAIVTPAHGSGLTYRELREQYYDENGLPC
jgi:hypothetical protein